MKKIFYLSIFCLITLACQSRDSESVIDLKQFTKITKEELRSYDVAFVSSFPISKGCSGDTLNANIYLVKPVPYFMHEDTIFIIDPCNEMPNYLEKDYPIDRAISILDSDTLTLKNRYFRVNVKPIDILKNKRYIISRVSRVED